MASIFQRRKGGPWYIKWYENGVPRRKSLNTRSKQEATWRKTELEQNLAAGVPVWNTKDCAVEDFTERMEEHYTREVKRRRVSPFTARSAKHYWNAFVEFRKPLHLSDCDTQAVAAFKAHLEDGDLAESSINTALLCLSSVFSLAIDTLGVWQGPHPIRGNRLVSPVKDSQRGKGNRLEFLSKEQIARLLEEAKKYSADMHLVVALGVYAGLRKNEIINARWSWFTLEDGGRVHVANDDHFTTKSARDRQIPLKRELREILERYRAEQPELYTDDAYVICPENAPKPHAKGLYRVNFSRAFKTVCKRAGLPGCTLHRLRHSFAAQYAQAGVSLYKIQHWLGHADPAVTQIYAHLAPQDRDIDVW
jgi:integrase